MLAGLEVRQGRLHQEDRASDVDLDRLGERIRRHFSELLGEGVGCVVDHDIDAAELGCRCRDQRLELAELAEMRWNADCVAAQIS